MKKIFLLFLIGTSAVLSFGQSQRFIMIEEFTNASCGPCASQNPAFDALLTANATKCTSIKHHTNWPGVDPMNAHNPTDAGTRVAYYQVTGVPYAVMDGTPIAGSNYMGAPANLTQAKIDAEYAVPSTFDLSMNYRISSGNDSIYTTLLGVCTEAVTGTMIGQIGVIEKHIHFATAPGTNGERDFYNVMVKMLPTAAGTSLPTSFEVGDYFIVQQSWKLASTIYSLPEVSTVGFVQNNVNKKVHQGANGSTTPLTMPFDDDVELMSATNYSTTNCSGSVSPVVTIRNNGNHAVTSVSIKYTVNGMTPDTYTWNGNLPTLSKTTIELPSFNFSPEATNVLQIYTDLVNSVADQYPKNDSTTISISGAPVSPVYATLNLHTDKAPEETTWDVKNSTGTVIASGGPYATQNHSYVETIQLEGPGCYTFTIYDSGGNGLCCVNGSGGYQLLTSSGSAIRTGSSFGSSEFIELKGDWATGIEQIENTAMKVAPNPVSGEAKVSFDLVRGENVVLNLFNLTGQVVRSYELGFCPYGNQEYNMDTHNLPAGIYILKLQAGNQVQTCRIAVAK
jgi:hypothetical protein